MDKTEIKLNQYIDEIRQRIDVDTIIVFGSYANKQHHSSSDIDVLIVSDDFKDMSKLEAYKLLAEPLWNLDINIDPISATTNDLKECVKASFLSEILRKGRVIFSKSA